MSSSDHFNTAHLRENLGRLAIKGGATLVIGQGLQLLLSITSTIVLARLLVPDDFGLIAMVLPFIGFLAFFRDSGLHMATIQQETINHTQISTLFWINLGMGFILMIFLALLAPVIAKFFGREELLWISVAYAINMLIGSASIQHSALLARQMAFGKQTSIGIMSQMLGIVVGVICAWFDFGYWSLIFMAITTTAFQTILLWSFSGWTPGLPHRGSGVRKMLAFGGGLTISNLFNQVTQNIDSILIGRILGAVPLGYYDRAKQLFLMPLVQLMGPMSSVAIPAISRMANDPARYAKIYLRIQEKILILTALFSVFFIVYGEWVIQTLLGPKWLSAGHILQAFAVGGLIIPLSASVSWLLVTQGRSRDLAYWAPFSLLFRCAAIVIGYSWGVVGIAISIALFQYISFITFVLWVGRKGPVTTGMVLRNMIPALFSAIVSCAIGYMAKANMNESIIGVSLGIGGFISSLVFFLVLWSIPAGKSALIDALVLAKSLRKNND